MMSQLERAINLAAKTGDKIIVVDELNDHSSVVMNLDEYEKLLNGENKGNVEIKNLTEEELLDKINRDIVTWREANKDKTFLEEIDDLGDDVEDEFGKDVAADESDFAKAMVDDDEGEEIIPDFTAPDSIAEEIVSEEKKEVPEENLYYYNEPEKNENESASAKATAYEDGFTSIKDELKKNKKAWEIPVEVKQAAEDAAT
jgi:hypothetical protein